MHFSHILFDLDGTLTDSQEGITNSIRYALRAFGIEEEDRAKLSRFIGPPLTESFMGQYGLSHAQALAAVEKYREYFRDTGIYENRVYPGIPGLLERLVHAGAQLYLATSKPQVFAERVLAHFSLTPYFRFICGSGLDGSRSDKADVIAFVLESMGLTGRSDLIMVGDRKHDVLGAKKTGLACVGVLYGYGDREELTQAGADYIAQDLPALERILKSPEQTPR